MLTEADIHLLARSWRKGRHWWERDAYEAIRENRYQLIMARTNRTEVYLVRMWLIEQPPIGQDDRFESGGQVFLHFFVRGDDDQALHDHPWNFRTRILAGHYIENLPPEDWVRSSVAGPEWNENTHRRSVGDIINRQASDLHCVSYVERGTFTLVSTGPRLRPWGFHPPGQPWVGFREYLGLDLVTTAAAKDLEHG